jgi:hypothetical protein
MTAALGSDGQYRTSTDTTAPDTTAPLRDQDIWLVLLPPQLVCPRPMRIRLLLRVTLPQPAFDLATTLCQ